MLVTFPSIIAKLYAKERQSSTNPFVSGISKDLLTALDQMLAKDSEPTRQ